jgi:hypothetical protein
MIDKTNNRKGIIVIGFVTISLLLLSVYFLFYFQNLKIVVFNKAGYDIDSLKLDNKFFHISKGDSIIIDNCISISMQSDLPFGLPQASIRGKNKDTFQLFFCGTGVEKIKKGLHKFDITISEDSNFYRLYWQAHK